MINSMTAFARAEKIETEIEVRAEIRTYNSRHIDYSLRVPHGYESFEEKIKGVVSENITRGRVELKLHIKDTSEGAFEYEVNEQKAKAYHSALVQISKMLELDEKVPLDIIAGAGGMIKPAEQERDLDKQWETVKECIQDALESLNAMRRTEGEFLSEDFRGRLDFIEGRIHDIETSSDGLLQKYQERLKERITALTKGMVDIDPARIAQESAFLADRSDISEEIVRGRSHVKQFRAIMDSDEPGGRKLNFLLQEFNREFNTIGSKAGNTDVAHMVVEVKSELEKLREQVQNVE